MSSRCIWTIFIYTCIYMIMACMMFNNHACQTIWFQSSNGLTSIYTLLFYAWHNWQFVYDAITRQKTHSTILYSVCHYADDVIKWKHFPRYWPFVRGINQSPVNSPQKGQWRRALMFSLICAWISDWTNNREAGDLRRHRVHYDVVVLIYLLLYYSY